jgi:UDP-N-acetylglucosamine 1-carboxyvinyltransferase
LKYVKIVSMDRLAIVGGVPLKGEVTISGSKNAALPVIAASILSHGRSEVQGIPDLMDVKTMGKLLSHMGARFIRQGSKIIIDTESINLFEAPYELVKTMRASALVLGPLLARFGKAKVSLPGGCAIGARPINLHLSGLQKMGATIELQSGYVLARANRLRGASIYFDTITVTGTENLMMAATLAKGTTVLENAAKEPEVVDLANCLIKMGAKINGAGSSVIEIEGVDKLKPIDNYEIIPDRIEAGTFMAMAAITKGEIILRNCMTEHLDAVIIKFKDAGVQFKETKKGLKVIGPERLLSQNMKTMPYPGFPTDMQAQFMAMMTVADGTSIIKETIFENRFMHVGELRRMGADITIEGGTATIKGVKKLRGAPVMATDLRASASLVVAALSAEGESIIHRIYHLDRGYEKLEEKLKDLGANIERITS